MNLSTIVPGGIICFFPSYEYEKKVHSHWDRTGLLDRIAQKKKVGCPLCGGGKGNLTFLSLSDFQGA